MFWPIVLIKQKEREDTSSLRTLTLSKDVSLGLLLVIRTHLTPPKPVALNLCFFVSKVRNEAPKLYIFFSVQ